MHTNSTPSPLSELRNYLVGLADEFRAERQFGVLLEVDTVRDIAKDDSARLGIATNLILAAERQDLTAAELIEKVLADGRVDPSEHPLLQNALALIRDSAGNDHRATELVSA